MLNTFIKLQTVSYCTEQECQEEEQCFSSAPVYELALPAKPSDVIAWIENKDSYDFWDAEHLRIGLADSCGNIVVEDIGTIAESDTQYYFSATIPADTVDGGYTLVIYQQLTIEIISITPETSPGACDASVTFEIPNEPAESFEWSLDGETYQESSTFNGVCQDQTLTVYVRIVGQECTSGEIEEDIRPVDCSEYQGWTLQQFQDAGIKLFRIYHCLLSEIQP